jgi:hypothetical protein
MPELKMSPSPGTRLVRHAGDTVTLELTGVPPGWTARVRTNLGRARRLREEIVRARFEKIPLAGASWRDLPLQHHGEGIWRITLPLAEVGYFKATGKRIFLMAPIHHHFEKKGWAEPKIIVRFWIVSILLALVSLTSLKVR